MYCTISTRTTETDQRRFAKKAQTKFPTHGLVGNSLLRRFAKLSASGIGIANALESFPFSSSFSLCLDYAFLKGELAKDGALFLSLLLLYVCYCCIPPKPTQGSCMYEGQPG